MCYIFVFWLIPGDRQRERAWGGKETLLEVTAAWFSLQMMFYWVVHWKPVWAFYFNAHLRIYFLILILKREGRKREEERNISQLSPIQAPMGINPTTCWWTGGHSNQVSHQPGQNLYGFVNQCYPNKFNKERNKQTNIYCTPTKCHILLASKWVRHSLWPGKAASF